MSIGEFEESAPAFKLRDYQRGWIDAFRKDVAAGYSRLLLDACGGLGKTSCFAALAAEEWRLYGRRTLVLENRQQLVEQTADRIRSETGLDVDIEMAGQCASPYAPIVVASVATIGRVNRLTAFAENHFGIVVIDECHHSLAPLYIRCANYFHYSSQSLAHEWEKPSDGRYKPNAIILGVTATPDLHGNRSLGSLFQKFTSRYSYLEAIESGWLVGLKEVNIPVKIDTRKFRVKRTGEGSDFSAEDESAALIPIIEELAEQIFTLAKDKKTMCFLPSLECARRMADALNRRGLKTLYVSGVCLDKGPKTEEFMAHGPGICLALCSLYVEGTDFPDVNCVAWMRATISPPFYKQAVMRASRPLPGLVSDSMTSEQRREAIAGSHKPWSLLISPFFISDRIDICSMVDLFVESGLKEKMKRAPKDMTDASKIRDFIAALEKAADKHRNRQPRTIDPVKFALSIGDEALAHYKPETAADAAPPSKAELDYLLEAGLDTTQIKTSGQAQLQIQKLQTRERLGLASPRTITQLTLSLGWPKEMAAMMKQKQAGVLVAKRVAYVPPREAPTSCYCNATSHPPCSFCESGEAGVP